MPYDSNFSVMNGILFSVINGILFDKIVGLSRVHNLAYVKTLTTSPKGDCHVTRKNKKVS